MFLLAALSASFALLVVLVISVLYLLFNGVETRQRPVAIVLGVILLVLTILVAVNTL